MCGITGILFHDHNATVDINVLIRSRDSLSHRGPDEYGIFNDGPIGLAHRRLSIIDLSSGKQPMLSADKNYCIVFNGEIYNYAEIKAELESKGTVFLTKSDTEVILNSYISEGTSCIKKLKGMFSFAIWDKRKQILFCGRDHLGKKPFYFYNSSDSFCFASEIKALLNYPSVKKTPNRQSIDAYLTFGYIPANHSAFKDIYKLPPAHSLIIKDGTIYIEKYWDLPNNSSSIHSAEPNEKISDELISIFDNAVNNRLMSEVALGAFLSGGVDSTSVVASMKKFSNTPVITNTVGFTNKQFDESDIAKKSSIFYNTDHRENSVTPDGSIVNKIVQSFDEPFADISSIPTYYVCQAARKNVTVALSGDGGDELFGGYNWYTTYNKNRALKNSLLSSGNLLSFFASLSKKPVKGKAFFRALGMDDWNSLLQIRSIFNDHLKETCYSDMFLRESFDNEIIHDIREIFHKNTEQMDPLRKMQYFDLKYYLPDDILVKVDRMSMANSLEVRAPLLDINLLEFAWKLPSNLKIHLNERKYIFKKAVEHRLPPGLLSIPKKGFVPPIREWLCTSMKDFTIDTLFSQKAINRDLFNKKSITSLWKLFEKESTFSLDISLHIWTLLMLELWYITYIDS